MAKYKLNWKDLRFDDFKTYLFAMFKAFIPKKKIKNLDELEYFIQTKSAWVTQVTLYNYLKTRMGTRYILHFENDEFMGSVNLAKWNIYSISLQDLTFFAFSYLKANFNYQDTDKAKEIFNKILDDEISNKMPMDIIDQARKDFDERFQNIKWDIYYSDLPFNPSALSLYKWAPIADELKTLDRKIVLNSIAKSQAVLTQEEKNGGICLLDIGAGVTSYSVFQEEGIVHSGIIKMGGDEVTQEIAYAFDTSLEEAKRLKESYGSAKSISQSEDQFIDFTQGSKKQHQLSSLDLSEVIEEAYLEIFQALKNELKHHNLDTIIKSGFVLCGGGCEIKLIEELVRGYFSKRVKIGKIQRSRISGLESLLTDYKYIGSIGLLLHEGDLSKANKIVK